MYLILAKTEPSFWAKPESWLAMLMVAAGLGLVIFVHEMGHFLVAKACGVKCEKFYIGFDVFDIKIGKFVLIPRALLKFQWGETEYGIGILPLGGYVKMLGQDDNPANTEKESERTKIRKEDLEGDEKDAGETAEDKDEFLLDPRSYTAKTVPQRMGIISAGVIMNLIFAVIFGTCAYLMGVEYTPCEAGRVVEGGAAYEAGMLPGDVVIRIGKKGTISEHKRFTWDLRQGVGLAGIDKDLHVLVRRIVDGKPKEIELIIRPKKIKIGSREMPSIGIVAVGKTKLNASEDPVHKHLPAGKTKKFKPKDELIAIAGSDGKKESVKNYYQMRSILSRLADGDIKVTVKRKVEDKKKKDETTYTTHEITVKPNYMKRLGLVMKSKPISGVSKGSPAEKAGIKKGDVITKINGNPLGDPMSLPAILRPYYGEEIEIEVVRDGNKAAGKTKTLQITPRVPMNYLGQSGGGSRPVMSVPSLGIIFPVSPVVQQVISGMPADKQGMKPGDKVVEVQYFSTDKKKKKRESTNKGKPLALDGYTISWPLIHNWLQYQESDEKIILHYKRGNKDVSTKGMSPQVTKEINPDRGFVFMGEKKIHQAKSFGEALSLGLRQTKEDSLRIVGFLKKLITGEISITNLGGPGTIAVVATSEASQGTSRLLMFLVLISANLAVVNFLPIPVLDGGHMLFLIAEGVRGKPVSEKLQMTLTLVGLAFVLCLMVFVIGLDVWNLSSLFG